MNGTASISGGWGSTYRYSSTIRIPCACVWTPNSLIEPTSAYRGGRRGHFSPSAPNRIYISATFVQLIENLISNNNQKYSATSTKSWLTRIW